MNWEALGAIGEVIGAVGVVVTLAFLTLQIRQNSREIVHSRTQRIFELMIETRAELASGPMAAIISKVNNAKPLTEEEAIRYQADRARAMNIWDLYVMGARQGAIRRDLDEVMSGRLLTTLGGDGPAAILNRNLWEATKHLYTEPFQKYVDDLIAQDRSR